MKDVEVVSVQTTEIDGLKDLEQAPHSDDAPRYLPATEWPVNPTPLLADSRSALFSNLYDLALFLLSLCLFVKIALVIVAYNLDRDNVGTAIDQATELTQYLIRFNGQMVTLFTILFGLVIATVVRRYALWKAQNGAYVHELEQLQGSTSLPSTMKLIYSLRAWSITSGVLAFVWAFSYLGSQASKEEYKLVSSGPARSHYIAVPAMNLPTVFDPPAYIGSETSSGGDEYVITNVISQFTESLTYSDNNYAGRGTDENGNVLVPDVQVLQDWLDSGELRSLRSKPITQGRHDWIQIKSLSYLNNPSGPVDAIPAWTSYSGTPFYLCEADGEQAGGLAGSPVQMLGKYQFSTNYFRFGCEYPSLQPYTAFPNGTNQGALMSLNMSAQSLTAPKDLYGKPLRTFQFWNRWTENDSANVSFSGSAMSVCNITSVNVDVSVSCLATGCFPHAVRYQNGVTAEQATNYSTSFDDDLFASRFFGNFSSLPEVEDQFNAWGQALFTNYSTDASDSVVEDSAWFARLTQLFLRNYLTTFYIAAQQNQDYWPNLTTVANTGADVYWVRSTLHGAEYLPQYAIYWPWLVIDLMSCTILCAATIISARLRLMTLAPDILGYVSSLTRDNPNLRGPLPDNGTGLDGISRARMLRSVKVKIGDVSGDDTDVARIGLAVVDITHAAAGPSNFDRVQHVRVEALRPSMSII